jgi:hypothetical protein
MCAHEIPAARAYFFNAFCTLLLVNGFAVLIQKEGLVGGIAPLFEVRFDRPARFVVQNKLLDAFAFALHPQQAVADYRVRALSAR